MHLIVDTTAGTLHLEDVETLTKLDGRIVGPGDGHATLAPKGRREGDHLWIASDELRRLAGEQSERWHQSFSAMIDYAESKGWVADGMVRLHLLQG